MNKNSTIALAVVGVLLLGAGAYAALNSANPNTTGTANVSQSTETVDHSQMDMTSPTATSTETATTDTQASTTVSGSPTAKTFEIGAGAFYFKPNVIKVKKGDTVTINIKNEGGFHDFVLPAYNVKTAQLTAGKTATVTFTADQVGSFEFYCSVGNHRAQGQTGTLIVEA